MDELDKQIFSLLLLNCRTSYRDIGKKVGLTVSAVKKRVDNLENSGFIDRYLIALSPDKINVRLRPHTMEDEFYRWDQLYRGQSHTDSAQQDQITEVAAQQFQS